MKIEHLRELYIKELQDLYDAENQIIKALPGMIRGATSGPLGSALQEHLETTKEQAIQLEELFSRFQEKPHAVKCRGMEGLLKEGEETVKEDMDPDIKDAAIIVACQKVEHYEIAGYGSVKTFAHLLGDDHAARVLEKILGQEKEADQKLTMLAEEINVEAAGGVMGEPSWREMSAQPGNPGSPRSHRDNS